jgi:hypothetical protein
MAEAERNKHIVDLVMKVLDENDIDYNPTE